MCQLAIPLELMTMVLHGSIWIRFSTGGAIGSTSISDASEAERFVRPRLDGHVGAPPPAAALVDEAKRQRLSAIQRIAEESCADEDKFWNSRLSNVLEYLDSEISLEEKAETRYTQLETLWKRDRFEPRLKWKVGPDEVVFPHTWVDKKSKGEAKSRFTVADCRKRQSKEAPGRNG
jgi:hypothetical protein